MMSSRDSIPHRHGQFGWDHPPGTQDVTYNSRYVGPPPGYRAFDERPFGLTRIPLEDTYPSRRVIVVGNNASQRQRISPRFHQSSHQLIRRYFNPETLQGSSESNGSKLTKEEQETVLKKLKKEIYNHMPKILARRVSLYYRDLNINPDAKAAKEKGNVIDEDRKSCAICLEDFEVREEVMVTPCSHMFHEECIVPWIKDHGQCPVCRATFYERRENIPASNNNRTVVNLSSQRAVFADQLFSLIQAVDEVFPWGV